MGFPQDVQDRALVASGRCCCICHKFCGTKINLHHIIQRADGGDDSFENCIPLCLNCHEDMGKPDPRHSTGKHYSVSELKMHRDNWYASIKSGFANAHAPVCEEDKELFNKIRSMFTPDVQGAIKNCDFRENFPSYLITTICDLCHLEENPENEFVDSELEMLRGTLFAAANKFRRYLAKDTFACMIGGKDFYVPRLWLLEKGDIKPAHDYGSFPDDGLEYDRPENDIDTLCWNRYYAEAQRLNDCADDLWHKYEEFIQQGRRIVLRQE